ncbi:MAG: PadR family transcriptional regulator [Actinobacteria bacterium]|nr:PadR family transcriptional regulator [Actinomycetota bacterium]
MRRMTHARVQVAIALLAQPAHRHWGYDLSRRSGVRSGVLYPLLNRMLEDGWLADGWEEQETARGRPPRRYYTVTDLGYRELGALLSDAGADARFTPLLEWASWNT